MRVQPKPIIGIVAYLAYVAIVAVLTAAFGPDFDEIAASVENIVRGVILPIGAASVAMVALTSWLGWWRPAMFDTHRAPAWVIIAPLVMVLVIVGNLATTDFGALDASYLIVLAVGMLLVGLGEELTTRGVLLVALRSRAKEVVAWLVSTLLFGLMHSLNFLFGQDLVPTLGQVGLTLIFGTGFYILRRATGSLIWPMLLHALWDFASFVNGEAGELGAFAQLSLAVVPLAIIVCLIWAIKGTRESLPATPTGQAVR